MKKIVQILLFILIPFSGFTGEPVKLGGTVVKNEQSIFENLSRSGDHTVLTAGIRAGGLETVLRSEGNYTLFAPVSNAIIHEIPAGRAEQLFNELLPEQEPELYDIVSYHIIGERILFGELEQRIKAGKGSLSLKTLHGKMLTLMHNDDKSIIVRDDYGRKSVLIQPDISQKNGFIHVVSQALLPEGSLHPRDYKWDCNN